jgi:hypothetical protein
MPIAVARAYIAEAKIEETEHFFGCLNADDLDALRAMSNARVLSGQHRTDMPKTPAWKLSDHCVECGVEIVVVHGPGNGCG